MSVAQFPASSRGRAHVAMTSMHGHNGSVLYCIKKHIDRYYTYMHHRKVDNLVHTTVQ